MSFAQHGVKLTRRSQAGSTRLAHVLLPMAIVGAVLTLAIGARLAADGGNLTGLVQFGGQFAAAVHPPSGAAVDSPQGYDGQFFYVQARDPLLLHDATIQAMRHGGAGFRMQRMAYPALAYVLAGGQASAIPFALVAINFIVLLGLTGGLALYFRRRGWTPLWAVGVALMPGMLLAAMRDLSDPLALAAMLAGLLWWRSGRRWPAAAALAVAVLTREVMMLAVVAVAADSIVGAWRDGSRGRDFWAAVADSWPVVVLPTVAFATWQAYITVRYGGLVGGAGVGLPLLNFVHQAQSDFHGYAPMAVWDIVYLGLVLAAVASAFLSLRQRVTITSAAACALALGVLIPTLGDAWSDTRLSAPLFALVLLDGLARGRRTPLVIFGCAAAMSAFVPLAIPGTF